MADSTQIFQPTNSSHEYACTAETLPTITPLTRIGAARNVLLVQLSGSVSGTGFSR